jgi:hypothetical protein
MYELFPTDRCYPRNLGPIRPRGSEASTKASCRALMEVIGVITQLARYLLAEALLFPLSKATRHLVPDLRHFSPGYLTCSPFE